MKLVIAEKNSVAQSLSRVIGATKRQNGYLEGNGYLVSWCVGHLVELSAPERYDEHFAKWRLEDLPILPERWLYEVSSATKKQFQILKSLMGRPDVESLVCATDAGREGELIFRLVYNQCRCKKPFERLWISSMEDTAIREGFAHLKPGTEYGLLYEAALCRERADWIVGMNATRLFSCLYGQTLAVGRVMTPTLAMVVLRDAQIAAFKPEPFWTVQITAGGIQPRLPSLALAEQFTLTASSFRFQQKEAAEDLAARCLKEGKAMIRTVETKEKLEKPPLLYDLTSLQRDANRILGFTAQQTLDYTQSLYEKKLVTYPRTDSRYLTDDMREMLPALVGSVAGKFNYAGAELRTDPVHPASVFDSSKVSDHHAIIPTKTMAGSDITGLSFGEKAVLQLIAARLLCAAAEDQRYAEMTVKFSSGNEEFTRKGKTVLTPGWKAIWQHFYPEKKKEEDASCPLPAEGTLVQIDAAEVKEGKTSPPKHYTEEICCLRREWITPIEERSPAWNRLVEGVKNGEITTVIAKDLSRIGRDHLQVGFFTDILFREKEIHFIAINNSIDSDHQETSEFAPFLNIMNEWYVRDTSKKIKTVLKARGNSGKAHTSNIPPYGYLKDPDNPDHWIIDEEAAEVVRRIYRLTIEGKGPYEIARELAENKVERPSYYLGKKGLGNHAANYDQDNPYMWRGNQVAALIARPEYIGKTVNFRTYKNSYKDKNSCYHKCVY